MQTTPDFIIVSWLYLALTIGMCLFGVLLFWHLQRIGKPFMAKFFWLLAFGYALVVLWRYVELAYARPAITTLFLGTIAIAVFTTYVAALFYTPFEPKRYDYDDDDEATDEPTYH